MLSARLGRQGGATLAELLVGMTVGLIVGGGALHLFTTLSSSARESIQTADLQQELRFAMELMTRDIRRAGYSTQRPGVDVNADGVVNTSDLAFNPFLAGINDLRVGNKTGEPADSCITFTYNLDDDSPPFVGAHNTSSPLVGATPPYTEASPPYDTGRVEMFGYRLNNGALQMRKGASSTSDGTFSCSTGSWEAITSATIDVTALSFTLTQTEIDLVGDKSGGCEAGEPCQCVRQVGITLTGTLVGDGSVVKSISDTVRVRNDKLIASTDAARPCRDPAFP